MIEPADTTVLDTPAADLGYEPDVDSSPELIEEELLVEDVSIDGMCGVY